MATSKKNKKWIQPQPTEKTFVGYRPFEWQLYVHRGINKYGKGSAHIHCVKAKRQIGKSFIIINELLRFAINYNGSVNGCLSPTLTQARKIFREIIKASECTGVVKKQNNSLLEIEFINDSSIIFKSAEQRDNLRGYTFDGILAIDEAAYISDDVWSIIKPATDVWRCPILMVSTPKFRSGFFFDNYSFGQLPEYQNNITSYDLCKFDTSALLSAESLEMYRKIMPKSQFITEYLGEFLDSDSIVFGNFKKCINNSITEPYNDLYIGIDWGSGVGKDETVITALNEYNQQVFLVHFNNKNSTETIDYIYNYIDPYRGKIRNILAENNGVGKPLCDSLRYKFENKLNFEEFITTNQSKAKIINNLQVAFEQTKIQLLDNEQQTAELSMYEAKYNKTTGNVSYNAPAGGNDDMCIALMLALQAKNVKNNSGKYNISFL